MSDSVVSASLSSCRAFLDGDVFVVENDRIRREFLWNGGNLATLRIRDLTRGVAYETAERDPDCAFPGETALASDGTFRVREVPASTVAGEALAVDVGFRLGGLEVRRTFTLRPGVPALSCSLRLRGRAASASWTSAAEAWERRAPETMSPRLDRLPLPSPKARVTAVELFDVTDHNNNLARTWGVLPYTVPLMLPGNILLAADRTRDAGLFVLKDGPCAAVQLANPGYDFSLTQKGLRVYGAGAEPGNLREDSWIPCYGDTVGVSGAGDLALLLSLKAHLASMRRYLPRRDPMIMLNTWGDCGADRRIGEASFNLDVTAGRRFGYHGSTRYGNLFLENRYTDWKNYYPHWTLRNLWQLSRWVQPQFLQVEFLNKWRNADRYDAGDPLAPSNVPFDYCFAVTMMGQPLAWMEASGLPEEAFALAPLVRLYRTFQADLHAGVILPIGSEPDRQSWTGFQSLQEGRGHFLVFREFCDREDEEMAVWGLEDRFLSAKCLLGHGKGFSCRVGKDGRIRFALPASLRFALYEYRLDDPAQTGGFDRGEASKRLNAT